MNKNAFEETLKEFYVLERQLACYSIWANHIIAPHGLKFTDLRTGLSDVVNFVALLQSKLIENNNCRFGWEELMSLTFTSV